MDSSFVKFRHMPCKLKWINSVTSLGVTIGNDINKIVNENFSDRMNKIENLSTQWCIRKLTLKEKVLVANTMFLFQLLYLGSCMHTPTWILAKYKEIMTRFMWNNKPSKLNKLQ